MSDESTKLGRRLFLTAAAAGVGVAALPATAEDFANSTVFETPATESNARANISSFRLLSWQDYFSDTKNGAILVDITSRALHFWSEDQSIYKLYPTSVPLSEELTKRGNTAVIRKVVNPRWTATKGELERNPDWPPFVAGGSPENPLGVRSLYLGWPTYEIHGTHDTRKIGRLSSSGCIGLYNEQIVELFDLAKIGTQVKLI
jgi:L,D-transpeptidase ErfK/SrfK